MAKKKVSKKKPKKISKGRVSILARIAANNREIRKNRDALNRKGEKLFSQAVREVFRKFPDLKKFGWNQYTPSWNDGDPCRFGLYTESLLINGEDAEGLYELEQTMELLSGDPGKKRIELERELEQEPDKSSWKANCIKSKIKDLDLDPSKVEKKYVLVKTLTDLLEAMDESVFEHMFGEGTVTVSREGTTVDSCEHD